MVAVGFLLFYLGPKQERETNSTGKGGRYAICIRKSNSSRKSPATSAHFSLSEQWPMTFLMLKESLEKQDFYFLIMRNLDRQAYMVPISYWLFPSPKKMVPFSAKKGATEHRWAPAGSAQSALSTWGYTSLSCTLSKGSDGRQCRAQGEFLNAESCGLNGIAPQNIFKS